MRRSLPKWAKRVDVEPLLKPPALTSLIGAATDSSGDELAKLFRGRKVHRHTDKRKIVRGESPRERLDRIVTALTGSKPKFETRDDGQRNVVEVRIQLEVVLRVRGSKCRRNLKKIAALRCIQLLGQALRGSTQGCAA